MTMKVTLDLEFSFTIKDIIRTLLKKISIRYTQEIR